MFRSRMGVGRDFESGRKLQPDRERPSLFGIALQTAIFAPAGNAGGPSFHFKSAAANMTCSEVAAAGSFVFGFSSRAKASEESARAAPSNATEVIFFIGCSFKNRRSR